MPARLSCALHVTTKPGEVRAGTIRLVMVGEIWSYVVQPSPFPVGAAFDCQAASALTVAKEQRPQGFPKTLGVYWRFDASEPAARPLDVDTLEPQAEQSAPIQLSVAESAASASKGRRGKQPPWLLSSVFYYIHFVFR
jgi:hypothetical protein